MIHEACELIATGLKDATTGVNVFAPLVPKLDGDPAIETCAIVHEFEFDYLASTPIPAKLVKDGPAILVRRGDDVGEFGPPSSPEVLDADGRIGVAVLLLYSRQAEHGLNVENRRLSALLRAAVRSIGCFFDASKYDARSLRDVQLVHLITPPKISTTIAKLSDVDLVGASLMLNINVTDRWAEGITPITP